MQRGASGEIIGRRYQILDTLGQGGMGTVHRAKDRLGGFVALKRLATSTESWNRALLSMEHAFATTPEMLAAGGGPPVAGRAAIAAGRTATSFAGTRVSAPSAPPVAGFATTALDLESRAVSSRSPVAASAVVRTGRPRDGQVAEMLRLTLAREFRLLSSLRHPNVISVLDYGFDDHLEPYFTMELLEHADTIMSAGKALPFEGKLDLLAQTLQALAYLHRRGVIHRDLKPGNVMVEGGRVKVLDFGVSMLRQHEVEAGQLIVGTLGYMAPELLGGTKASEASDLYAVGMVAYELFAGRYPFEITSIVRLKDDILRLSPDLGPIDERVAGVVGWLLQKQPERRPTSVDEVFEALGDWMGKPLAVETAATRESFLQAAELVGRDAEIGILGALLDAAMGGRGGAALVGGESGVGKSRLLDEVRARALVDGVVVLRGQAVSEGGGPYHVFREALRGLSLRVDLDDLDASVLEAVVPEIGALLEREIPERPEIGPEAAQARLLRVVEGMFRRLSAPVLLILEDLQWAGSESLKMLARIAKVAGELTLFVVGSYRDDERSDLPSELPGMRTLELRRLRPEDIAALAASMLGERGRRPEVIERLERETEGNAFFVVEIVRALAEEAGALSRVGVEPMPKTVSSGGMHRIVRRRLGRVPRRARALLETAAVIGRQVDRPLLQRFAEGVDLEVWLTTCVNVAVLESHEGSFRFAHDKLREGLLADLSPDASRDLHLSVAEAIEAEYPGEPEHITALAHHYAAAGVVAKEAHYCALAGEQSLQSSAYNEAAQLYERAIDLVARSGEGAGRTPTTAGAGGALGPIARMIARAAPLLPIRLGRVDTSGASFLLGQWEGRLSEVQSRLSNYAEAFRHGDRALGHLGLPMPSGKAGLVLGLPVQIAVRALESLWPAAFAAGSDEARALLLEALRIQTTVTETTFYTQEALPMLYSGLSILNLGEPAGPSASLACGYALMAAVAGVVPLHPMAEAWSRRAVELVEAVGKPYDVAYVLQRVASYRLWMARWGEAEPGFARCLEIARQVGDQRLLGDAMSCLVMTAIYQGRFVHAEGIFSEMSAWMHRTEDPQLLCGGRILGAGIKLRRGKHAEALALSLSAQPLVDTPGGCHDVLRGYALLGLGRLRAGEPALARAAAEKALGVIRATRPVAYWTYDGIAAVAEVLLSLWETSGEGPESEIARRAGEACKGARAFAKVFPIGEPCALLSEGMEARLSGDNDRAEKLPPAPSRARRRSGCRTSRVAPCWSGGAGKTSCGPRRCSRSLGAEHDLARAEARLSKGRRTRRPQGRKERKGKKKIRVLASLAPLRSLFRRSFRDPAARRPEDGLRLASRACIMRARLFARDRGQADQERAEGERRAEALRHGRHPGLGERGADDPRDGAPPGARDHLRRGPRQGPAGAHRHRQGHAPLGVHVRDGARVRHLRHGRPRDALRPRPDPRGREPHPEHARRRGRRDQREPQPLPRQRHQDLRPGRLQAPRRGGGRDRAADGQPRPRRGEGHGRRDRPRGEDRGRARALRGLLQGHLPEPALARRRQDGRRRGPRRRLRRRPRRVHGAGRRGARARRQAQRPQHQPRRGRAPPRARRARGRAARGRARHRARRRRRPGDHGGRARARGRRRRDHGALRAPHAEAGPAAEEHRRDHRDE